MSPVRELLQELDRCARLPLSRSVTNPAAAYTSPEFFAWELEHVFRAEWLCVAHASQIPQIGDFLNLDLLGEPLTVVRGRDRAIHVLSRVCPHRGMDIMPPGFAHAGHLPADRRAGRAACGNAKVLLCPYHHWSFDFDGSLKGCTEMHGAEGFRREDNRLAELRSEIWEGFVFVNFSGKAPPLREQLASLLPKVAAWDMGRMQVVNEQVWDCPFNWKLLIENWMESYHHLGAHQRTLQPMMPARDTWTETEQAHFLRAHLPYKPALVAEIRAIEAAGKHPPGFLPVPGLDDVQRFEWGLHLGLPCFMFLVGPDRVVWYRLQPIAPDRCRLLTTCMVTSDAMQQPDFETVLESETRLLTSFHLEDMEMCSGVQRGQYSSMHVRGRLSHLEMPVWLIQRYVAARGRGTWPTRDLPAAPGQRTE